VRRLISQNYIKQLEETLQRNQELEKENEILKKENEELKNRLLFYENPNTPPSARQLQKTDKKPETIPIPKKRGAPNGHKGATRPTKEPDEIIDVIADHCEKCNSSNIEKQKECETSVIEDLPPPQKIRVTQYNRWKVKCNDCGQQFFSKHPDCPKKGNFGIFLVSTPKGMVLTKLPKFYSISIPQVMAS
jgi:transposase